MTFRSLQGQVPAFDNTAILSGFVALIPGPFGLTEVLPCFIIKP